MKKLFCVLAISGLLGCGTAAPPAPSNPPPAEVDLPVSEAPAADPTTPPAAETPAPAPAETPAKPAEAK